MISDLEFSELLSVKICHDLSGPIGAVNNGIELLHEDDEDIRNQSLNLVEESAAEAVARISFIRHAYGKIGGSLDAGIIKKLSDDFFRSKKIEIKLIDDGQENFAGNLTGEAAKLILNGVKLVAASLIFGGLIEIYIKGNPDNYKIAIKGSGKNIKPDEDLISFIDGLNIEVNIKNIHSYFMYRIVKESGKKVTVENSGEVFTLLIN